MKKIAYLLSVVALLAACDKEEMFPDPAFKACIENRLAQYTEIHDTTYSINNEKDLEVIKSLGCDGGGIKNIEGVQRLPSLVDFGVSNGNIKSLEPLRGMNKIKELQFPNNQIYDLSPLSEVMNMESLVISNNKISNLQPLSQIHKLSNLLVYYNCIEDFSQLQAIYDANPDLKGISGASAEWQDLSRCQ